LLGGQRVLLAMTDNYSPLACTVLSGAFLIPYMIMLLMVGIPLFFLEVCWAQFASLGPIAIWNCSPLMKGAVPATL